MKSKDIRLVSIDLRFGMVGGENIEVIIIDTIIFKRIRCIHCPRYAYYDRESKVSIFIDTDMDKEKTPFHISWKPWRYPKDQFYPQVNLKDLTFEEAKRFGVKSARDGTYTKYGVGGINGAFTTYMVGLNGVVQRILDDNQ